MLLCFLKGKEDKEFTCESMLLEIFLGKIFKKMVKIAVSGDGNWVAGDQGWKEK